MEAEINAIDPDIIKEVKNAFDPKSIIDFLPADTFYQLLKGFYKTIGAGIAFYYNEWNDNKKDWDISDKDKSIPGGGELLDYYSKNVLCRKYAELTNENRDRCEECNRNEFRKNINKLVEKNDVLYYTYNCWLGFREYCFFLTINDRVYAAFLSGQVIPQASPEKEETENNIKNEINKISNEGWISNLFDAFEKEKKRQSRRSKKDINFENELIEHLKITQKTLQDIIERLYQLNQKIQTDQLLKSSSEYLDHYNPQSEEDWIFHYDKLFIIMQEITGFDNIYLFNRRGARYKLLSNLTDKEGKEIVLRTRDVIETIPENCFKELETTDKNKFRSISDFKRPVHVYRHDITCMNTIISHLIVINGLPHESYNSFMADFCSLFINRQARVSLIFRLQENYQSYLLNVGKVAHNLRTPLQSVFLDLNKIQNTINVEKNDELYKRLEDSGRQVFGAREELFYLLENINMKEERCNFPELVNLIIEENQTQAEAHPCELVKDGIWPAESYVFIKRIQIKIAIVNLIDNAIKYSWKGHLINNGTKKLNTVDVNLICKNKFICCRISNYGVGIPPDFLAALNEETLPGRRANVLDKRVIREGTGWGLFTAKTAFSENGGFVEIESRSADNNPRIKGEEYHRYKTTVSAYLPLLNK